MISHPKATVAFDFIIHVFLKKHQTNMKMEDKVVEVCGENWNNVQNKTPFVEFSQKVTLRFEEQKIRGDGFLRGVHSSMFFRFDWQDLTMEIYTEFFGTHLRIW